MSIYVGGSEAPKLDTPERQAIKQQKRLRMQQERLTEMKKAQRAAAEKRRNRQLAIRNAVFVGFSVAVLIISAISMVSLMNTNTNLKGEINSLEARYDDIKTQNDSKEYDINNFVDLNAVIKIATEELGMTRSSANQIITYQPSQTEYIQQLADVED